MFSLWCLHSNRSDYQICCHCVSHVTCRCVSAAVWKCSLWAAVSRQAPPSPPVCAPPAFFFPLITAYRSHAAPIDICYAQHFPYSVNTPRRHRRLQRPPGKGLFVQTGGWHWRCKFVLGVTLLFLLLMPSSLLLPRYVCLGADFLISAAAVECVYENPRHDSRFIRNVGPHWHSAGGAHVCGCDNHLRGREE